MRKYTYVFEILGLLALLSLINLIWKGNNLGFIGVKPHPYWVVVLALAVKYEFRQAFTAAVISGIVYYIFLIFTHRILFLAEYFEFEYFRPFFLFIVIGGFIGQVRKYQNQKYTKLLEGKINNEKQLKSLKRKFNEMLKIKDELSNRIFSKTTTVSTVYQLSKKINIMNIEQLIPASLDFVAEYIGAEKCSFYILENNQLELKASKGWIKSDKDLYNQIINNEIVIRSMISKKVAGFSEIYDMEIDEAPQTIEGNVVMSAPITFGQDKSIYGIINIEKMPFINYNSETLKLLAIIADWISHSITIALEYKGSFIDEKILIPYGVNFEEQLQKYFENRKSLFELQKN